ncbi:uncharacterized protein LOC119912569 [Micropterus salmoides]|uniref:uncharacterized protein LOC119912569 n=1 Tax=Micropterus salmoides TaxID=27706 RepID=UPI0018ED3714|nr:uncharacterized protein LOC119912569 [Micropterus salmoides]
MLENSAVYSRLLFAFVLVCAAVMSFIMYSDAARASPITTKVDNRVKHIVLRRLFTPYSQHLSLSTGLLSTETGLQTGTNSETETSTDYGEASSVTDHQSNPLRFTDGSFSYNQNNPDNRHSQMGITRVQSEVRPASNIFTSHSQHGGQSFERRQSRVNLPLSQRVAKSATSYNSYPMTIRKSSHKVASSPFHQSSSPSQVWEPTDAQEVLRKDSSHVAEDKIVWQPSDSSSQTGKYWSTLLPSPRGHYSVYKETNELTEAWQRSTSSGIQSSKFPSSASQTAPHAPSVSNSLEASVIKSNPSPEKLTSSIRDSSQGLDSSGSETLRHKNVQSYLFKDSQTSVGGYETGNTVTGDGPNALATTPHKQRPSDAQVYGRFSSNFKQLQQSQKKDPTNDVQNRSHYAAPLYHNVNLAKYGARTDSFTKYHRTTAETLAQNSVHHTPGKDNTVEIFDPIPHADFQGNYATGSEKSEVSSLVTAAIRGSMHAYKPGQIIKGLYGFRGCKNASVLSSSGCNERANSQQYSFEKGKFKITNKYPSLSSKYSFGQRKESTLTTTPAKLERTPTVYSSPSTGTLDIAQTMTTPRPFTSGFKEALTLMPEIDAGMGSNPDRGQGRSYGVKGFGPQPIEGAKTSLGEPEKPARVQQGFERFKLRSLQIQQPKSSRIHRCYNKTGETEPGSSHVFTVSQDQLSIRDLKPLLKTLGSPESAARFTSYKYKNHKIYSSGKFKGQNPTTASHIISSSYLRSAGDLKVESSPKSEPKMLDKTKPVAKTASLLNRSTSSMVRGTRVKGKRINGNKLNDYTSLINETTNVAIVRLPTRPASVKAVTYKLATFADILGSASFSGVRATTLTPVAPADKDYVPNTTATTKQREGAEHKRDKTRIGPEARAEDEEDHSSSVEENKLGVKSEDVDSDTNTSDLFLDHEGSGSGGFNMFDVLSADTTESQGLSEDLLELDYLRISTGNISFKSMKLSHAEK